ncbi:MAG: 30S ribosomal protein S12 methylthiotransferase RimO [Pseudomonadota bacterium]
MIPRSLHFISLGCPKNLVDSEVMLGLLADEGFVLTADAHAAEVIIINTCAFIEDAKKEAIGTIFEMAQHKKDGKCKLLIVAGCLPQRYSDEVRKLFPEVDMFVGAGEFMRIAELIKEWKGVKGVHVGRPQYLYDHETPRFQATPGHRAYIKIAEGCFHPCSFCIIPKIRGSIRSRAPESVVKEAKAMLARGVKEINLVAQDTTAYGKDVGSDLAALLESLALLPGQKWIRFLYAYPHAFPKEVIDVMRSYPDICKYVDVPIQHINERVLTAMHRKGEGHEIRELIENLRTKIPDISLRTSLIVGFPGETDKEFDELMDFVRDAKFDNLGVFTYSPEEGTPAAKLSGRVPARIAQERKRLIMDVQRDISRQKNAAYIGRTMKVLVEGPSEETPLLIGARHQGQAPDIDGLVYINEGNPKVGEFCEVEITESHDYDLVGRVDVIASPR